jgi:hypothetical protein
MVKQLDEEWGLIETHEINLEVNQLKLLTVMPHLRLLHLLVLVLVVLLLVLISDQHQQHCNASMAATFFNSQAQFFHQRPTATTSSASPMRVVPSHAPLSGSSGRRHRHIITGRVPLSTVRLHGDTTTTVGRVATVGVGGCCWRNEIKTNIPVKIAARVPAGRTLV